MTNAKISAKTKTLALQMLPKYIGKYPALADTALDILVDLFEEAEKVISFSSVWLLLVCI